MQKVSIADFRANIPHYLERLPLALVRYRQVVAVIKSYKEELKENKVQNLVEKEDKSCHR